MQYNAQQAYVQGYGYPHQYYAPPQQDVPPPPNPDASAAPPLPAEPPPPGGNDTQPSAATANADDTANAAAAYAAYGTAAGYQYGSDNSAAWAAYYQQQQYYQQGQWNQQWPGYAGQPQPYQYPQAQQSYMPIMQSVSQPAQAATPPAPVVLPAPRPSTGANTASGTASTPPWLQTPSSSSPAVVPANNGATNSSQSQQPSKQPVGFYIRPQMPKSRLQNGRAPAASLAAAPAYVSVADKAAGTKAASGPAAGSGNSWPASLKAYVERAFAQVSEDRAGLQEKLKQIINDAKAKGELWTRSWDTMPLPSSSASQETSAAAGPQPAPWVQAARANRYLASDSVPRFQDERRRAPSPKRKRSWRAASSSSSGESKDESERNRRPRAGERARRASRADRFKTGAAVDAQIYPRDQMSQKEKLAALAEDVEQVDWDQFVVKGTQQELEKSYFRLTSAPAPSTVRPEAVLRRAYDRLVRLLREDKENYFYALDQFKGMRQDCTVQHLRNDLTVLIYEAHARAALEYGDHAEYNQCQTQLDFLYRDSSLPGCREEFLAYRILYQTAHAKQGESSALLHTLRSAVAMEDRHPAVQHALEVREAVFCNNCKALFRLYRTAPSMGRALMDVFIDRFRFAALNMIVRAHKPHVQLRFLTRILGFLAPAADTEDVAPAAVAAGISLPGSRLPVFRGKHGPQDDPELAAEDCIKWLEEHGAVVTKATGGRLSDATLDCKSSATQLFMPAPVAVAHGDANLAIDDFLKSVS
ncbi:g56 [Coccomyxa elongata]